MWEWVNWKQLRLNLIYLKKSNLLQFEKLIGFQISNFKPFYYCHLFLRLHLSKLWTVFFMWTNRILQLRHRHLANDLNMNPNGYVREPLNPLLQLLESCCIFCCAPFAYLYFLSFQLLNEPGLAAGIDLDMALTPFPYSIWWYSNPWPSNSELNLLTTRPDFRPATDN